MDLRSLLSDLVNRKDVIVSRLELLEIIVAAEDLLYEDTPETRFSFLQFITNYGYVL
jgi:hypothetical protein